ncbi:gliding motility-associated C-terminal domain-containing protein [Saprospiraceae bacterium]|nr:gliding motility-associated C-terminal domain-containing protein [Saprospiraceae bacterium]
MKYLTIILTLTISFQLSSQITNDDCFGAIDIPSVNNYCSNDQEFSNVDATPDPPFANNCFISNLNGVWFSFVPTEPAVLIQVFSGGTLGTLQEPRMALFTGSCNAPAFIDCSPGRALFTDEFTVESLTIGQRYFLFVESGNGSPGTFKLCINDFIAPPSPESDCDLAVVLCDTSPFTVESITSAGQDASELDAFPDACLTEEFNSVWYKWTCDQPGSLTFTLTPNNFVPGFESDDIDFVLFELPNGLENCNNKELLRCMASGANVGQPFEEWEICNGPTGLQLGDGDISEAPGCQPGNNNFVEAIQMESGVSYALVVMNFTRSGLGFSIDFGGTGTFLGPVPAFDLFTIDDFECDKRIEITNTSNSLTDPIVNFAWNFGNGAEPQTATGEGPHVIVYESFGTKSIALTVESTRGCIVTEILDIDVEACCADTSTLSLLEDLNHVDLTCFESGDGAISVENAATGGAPEYNFSLNGAGFIPNTIFGSLEAGTYEVIVQDIKGCVDTSTVTLTEPEQILTDAGPDVTVDLGFSAQLNATYSPMNPGDIIEWTPAEGLSCTDCLNPVAISPGTTEYTFTVTNADGCVSQDFVIVTTNQVCPLYAPNVITPNSNDENSTLKLGLGPAAEIIEDFRVYDRWGNLVYTCFDIEPNDGDRSWDGIFGTCDGVFEGEVEVGVYTWTANVRFIDDSVKLFSDDVTVIR